MRKIYLKVIISSVEINVVEITRTYLGVMVIEQFNVFFIIVTDEINAVLNLIFRYISTVEQGRENCRNGFDFRAGIKDSGVYQLRKQIENTELKPSYTC